MSRLDDLSSFPELEGHIPCILCKGESSHTLIGDHWKCSVCSHVFNQDGSDIKVQCYCDTCCEKIQQEETASDKKGLNAALDNLKTAVKDFSKKKKKKKV